MAKQSRTNKSRSSANKSAGRVPAAPTGKQTAEQKGGLKRIFTIIISVIVVLGLMVPVAGIGVASCSIGTQSQAASGQ